MNPFVDVKVSPSVKAFFLKGKADNCIVVRQYDTVGMILFPLLQRVPLDYTPAQDSGNTLRFELKRSENLNTDYKNYLDEISQNTVNNCLKAMLHHTFYHYVFGFVLAGGSQDNAIISFFEINGMDWDETLYDTFRKSWRRSAIKTQWKENQVWLT